MCFSRSICVTRVLNFTANLVKKHGDIIKDSLAYVTVTDSYYVSYFLKSQEFYQAPLFTSWLTD